MEIPPILGIDSLANGAKLKQEIFQQAFETEKFQVFGLTNQGLCNYLQSGLDMALIADIGHSHTQMQFICYAGTCKEVIV